MRIQSLVGPFPVAVCFDFLAAFPSLAHERMLAVLDAMQAPAPILRLVRALYEDCFGHGVDRWACCLCAHDLEWNNARVSCLGVHLCVGL